MTKTIVRYETISEKEGSEIMLYAYNLSKEKHMETLKEILSFNGVHITSIDADSISATLTNCSMTDLTNLLDCDWRFN